MPLSSHRPLALLLSLFAAAAVRADFTTGQPADRLLGAPPYASFNPTGVAVDPLTLKVFVSDWDGHRILRYSSTAALQNDSAPEAVIGQADFYIKAPHTTATGLNHPAGLAIDNLGRLWVADHGNHRVLRFDNASSLATGAAATSVLGQANFTSATSGTAENRLKNPECLAVDQSGRLWLVDSGNHRILHWNNAASLPALAPADGVLGQPNFTSNSQSFAGTGLSSPSALALEHSNGVLVRLWVADSKADRVLAYNSPATKPNGASADKILGASTFTRGDSGTTRSTFFNPSGLAIDGTTLWVADSRHDRLLRFLDAGAKANGADADAVLGQLGFTDTDGGSEPNQLFLPSALTTMLGRLWIADSGNDRLVRHDAASAKSGVVNADGTLGQYAAAGPRLHFPEGCAVDPLSGKLFVAESGLNRVLRYGSAAALSSGAVPEAVLGQPDFSTISPGTTAAKMQRPGGLTVDAIGNLWVADTGNSRVLGFGNAATLPNGAPAAKVFGQSGFTTSTGGTTASRMDGPLAVAVESGVSNGATVITRLWVADKGNHRVLRIENPLTAGNGSPASGVLGQSTFSTSTSSGGAAGLNSPYGIAVESNGRLWVVDLNNQRVLRFDNAATKPNGASANGVLLQSTLGQGTDVGSPTSVCVTPAGRLFIGLGNGHRVLWFNNAGTLPNGSPPHGALGQPDLLSTAEGWGFNGMGFVHGIAFDPISGQLWVAEDRMLQRYSPTLSPLQQWRVANFGIPTSSGAAANHADPDGDHIPNIVEYVISQNPNALGGLGGGPPVDLVFLGRQTPVRVDLRLLTTYDSRVKLTIQSSPDLQNWTPFATRTGTGAWSVLPDSTTLLSGGGRTWFKFSTPSVPQSTAKQHFRLQAEELP